MRFVMAFGLGPVQDFIASARRTRDLWFGSYLLSEASRAAASALLGRGARLIFPVPEALGRSEAEQGNVSNKLLVVFEGSQEEARAAAEYAVKRAKMKVLELAAPALGLLSSTKVNATAQLDDLLEAYWAAVEDTGDYAASRNEAEALLSARKNTRDFAPVSWGAAVPKSQLDGQRESVINKELTLGKRRQFGIREAEELCAPGLVKRTGLRWQVDEARFMSTSHVAAQPYLDGLAQHRDQRGIQAAWATYRTVLRKYQLDEDNLSDHANLGPQSVLGRMDGRVLYGTRLHEVVEGLESKEQQKQAKSELETALQAFLRAYPARSEVFGALPPDPYYAVFQADGDGMGRLIDAQSEQGQDAHQNLSRALFGFSGKVGQIVRSCQGSLIYSGGDDMLALLPLHRTLECLRRVDQAYRDALENFGIPGELDPPTLSGGLVIAHFLTSLQDTLTAVRRAEHRAKDVPGKGALTVSLRRRSGAPITLRGKWEIIQETLESLTLLHEQDDLPVKFAYNVRVLADELGAQAHPFLVQAELARVLGRKRQENGEQLSQSTVQKLNNAAKVLSDQEAQIAAALTAEGRPHQPSTSDPNLPLRALSDGLIIALAFAKAQAQAGLNAAAPQERAS